MNERMRQGISLWGMAAALALLAGCTNDPEETATPADGRVALEVTGGIEVNTRAHDTQWDANDAIGIYMLETGTNTVADGMANRRYTTGNGTGAFAPAEAGQTVYFPVNASQVDLLAYYPHRASLDNNVYKVDVSNQQSQKDIDLMGAAKVEGKNKLNPQVSFRFKHLLVNLQLTIQADGKALKDADLDGMTVKITNQPTTMDFDVLKQTFSNIGAGKSELSLFVSNGGLACEGIVLPAASTDGMHLVFRLKNQATFSWDIHSAKDSQSFIQGCKYKYDITINGTGLEVTSTVADWDEGNGNGESGTAQ